MDRTVYIEPNQNITDICLQEYGNLDNLVALHLANGFDEIPAEVMAGDAIVVPEAETDMTVYTILQRKKPATQREVILEEVAPGGIEYMGIEIDFIVS
jgi:hypothetical protein